jgi:Mg-chelatase subunit ChlD
MLKKIISILIILGLSISIVFSSSIDEKVCLSSNKIFYNKYDKLLKLQYSFLSYNSTRAVYYLGKPANNALMHVNSITTSFITGLGGGVQGAIINVLVDTSKDIGLYFLESYLKTPRLVSRDIANRMMEEGIKSYNENYKLYKRGWSNLSDKEKQHFRRNQIKVNMLGESKKLYNKTKNKTVIKIYSDNEILKSMANIEKVFNKSSYLGNVLDASKIAEILLSSNIDIHFYKPFDDYITALSNVKKSVGVIECQNVLNKKTTAKQAQRNIILVIDTSGSMQQTDPNNLRKEALSLLSHTLNADTLLSVVTFANDSNVIFKQKLIGPFGDQNRNLLRQLGAQINSDGGTNIQSGLTAAAKLLKSIPGVKSKIIVLLTDGQDNNWKGQVNMLAKGTTVHTIALSDGADRVGLSLASSKTGGIAEIARNANDIHRILTDLIGTSQNEQVLAIYSDILSHNGEVKSVVIPIETQMQGFESQLSWPGSNMDLSIIDPNGKTIDTKKALNMGIGAKGKTYNIIRLSNPIAGAWKFKVKAIDVNPAGEPFTLRVVAKSPKNTYKFITNTVVPEINSPFNISLKNISSKGTNWQKVKTILWKEGKIIKNYTKNLHSDIGLFSDTSGSKIVFEYFPKNTGIYRVQLQVEGKDKQQKSVVRSIDRTFRVASTGKGIKKKINIKPFIRR